MSTCAFCPNEMYTHIAGTDPAEVDPEEKAIPLCITHFDQFEELD